MNNVVDLGIVRASRTRPVTQVFSLMVRGTEGTCCMCKKPIKAKAQRGKNHATGEEFCKKCWKVQP